MEEHVKADKYEWTDSKGLRRTVTLDPRTDQCVYALDPLASSISNPASELSREIGLELMRLSKFLPPADRGGADRFEMTPEGCVEAEKWLKMTGQLHLLQKEQSTDGWTLIALANSLYRKVFRN